MNCSEFKALLDSYMDGEIDEQQRSALKNHAAQCEACRLSLSDSERLRGILSQMDDGLSVPLSAQAAWRSAVKKEAKRSRLKRLYKVCGAAAAVCVLVVGVAFVGINGDTGSDSVNAVVVGSDGLTDEISSESAGETNAAALEGEEILEEDYVEYTIHAEDVDEAYGYLMDLITEYGGTAGYESQESSAARVFVQIPGENAGDFLSAVNGIGIDEEHTSVEWDETSESVSICVIIAEG